MWTFILLYLLFGVSITTSSRTSLVWGMSWYYQLLNVVGFPIVAITMLVKVSTLAIKLTLMMDEIKNEEIKKQAIIQAANRLGRKPIPDLSRDDISGPIHAFDSEKAFKVEEQWVTIQVQPGDYVLKNSEMGLVVTALTKYHSLNNEEIQITSVTPGNSAGKMLELIKTRDGIQQLIHKMTGSI